MAGDWIKMRADLFTHPKVVRISSALKADNLRTVGGLMSAWCLFDAHSIDGRLSGYSMKTLDDHLRWEGFSAAMRSVGWLESGSDDDGEFLVLPRFDAHNGHSAKRRAQDADRKKDVRKTSALEADKLRTREEKRREEKKEQDQKKKQPPQAAAPLVPPDWIDPTAWSEYLAMRKKKRAPPTTRACELVVAELTKLKASGQDPNAVLDQSTRNSWTDVYALKSHGANHATRTPSRRLSAVEQVEHAIAERKRREYEAENRGVVAG